MISFVINLAIILAALIGFDYIFNEGKVTKKILGFFGGSNES